MHPDLSRKTSSEILSAQSPEFNNNDLTVFPAMSKRHSIVLKKSSGLLVLCIASIYYCTSSILRARTVVWIIYIIYIMHSTTRSSYYTSKVVACMKSEVSEVFSLLIPHP